MKKFSVNLLKVGLLLIFGLCMFSIGNEVSARSSLHLRTYYAYPGQSIKIKKSGVSGSSLEEYVELWENPSDSESGLKKKLKAIVEEKNLDKEEVTIRIPYDIEVNKSYYFINYSYAYSTKNQFSEIYICPKLELTDSQGNSRISMYVGDTEQIKYKNNHAYWKDKGATNSKTDNSIHNLSDLKATDVKVQTAEKHYTKLTEVSFKSNDTSVATVDGNGLITAKKAGTTTITMTREITQQRIHDNNPHTATSTFTESIEVTVTDNTPIYNVTLDYNGGKDKDGRSELTLPDPGGDGKITIQNLATDKNYLIQREGYELTGWKYNKKTYKVGETIEFKGDIKIVAQWKKTDSSKTPAKPKEPAKLQDANGTEFAVGNYVKYTDNTNEGGWNLRKTARGKILGEIKTGTMLEVTEVSKTDICIKVKVLDGEMEGKEGWLTISAKENFEILKDYTPGEVDDKDDKDDKDDSASLLPGLEEFDFGELNGILKVIWNLIMKLIENLPTIIEKASPLVETGLTAIGGLVSGLMQ